MAMNLKYVLLVIVLIAGLVVWAKLATPKPLSANLYAGNLHMHTDCSDGKDSYDEMIEESVRLGFKFVAITDHNICPGYTERCRNETRLLCIPAMEFTTPNGHILAVDIMKSPSEEECKKHNDTGTCDGGLSLVEAITRIHAQGGIAIAAHPVMTFPNDQLRAISTNDLPRFDAMECDHPNYGPTQRAESKEIIKKVGIACVFDSDAHTRESLGTMYDVCKLENLSKEAVKAAIVNNQCHSSRPSWIWPLIR